MKRALIICVLFIAVAVALWIGHVDVGVVSAEVAGPSVGIDGAACAYATISDALAAVSPNQTIFIMPGTYPELLGTIDVNVTLVAARVGTNCAYEVPNVPNDTVIIDGGGGSNGSTGGLVKVTNGATVRFRHITLRNATATDGGVAAVELASELILDSSNIAAGLATNGGGVYSMMSTLTLENGSEVVSNTAMLGGGVFMTYGSVLNLMGGYIGKDATDFNSATGNGGGIFSTASTLNLTSGFGHVAFNQSSGGNGGGIYADTSVINIERAAIENNQANEDGGGIYLDSGRLTMVEGRIDNNQVLEVTAGNEGGGIYATNNALVDIGLGTLSRERGYTLQVMGNTAYNGGGIYVTDGAHLNLHHSADVRSNSAFHDGGGVYATGANTVVTVTSSADVRFNTAGHDGGGIYANWIDQLTIKDSDISSNTSANAGGGIRVNCSDNPNGTESVTMERSHVYANSASNGGGVYLRQEGFGAIVPCQILLRNMQIYDNVASNYGGGIYILGVAVVKLFGSAGLATNGGCEPVVLGFEEYCSNVYGNSAQRGGAVYVVNSGNDNPATQFSAEVTAFIDNTATDHGAVIYFSHPQSGLRQIVATFSSVYMRGNDDSPAIETDSTIDLTLLNSTIVDGNQNPLWLDEEFSKLTLIGTVIHGNEAGPYRHQFLNLLTMHNYIQNPAPDSSPFPSTIDNTIDPGFITDPVRSQHRIDSESPLFNAGGSIGFSIDADLNLRPADGAFDIGAFEYGAVPLAVGLVEQQARPVALLTVLGGLIGLVGVSGVIFGRKHTTATGQYRVACESPPQSRT